MLRRVQQANMKIIGLSALIRSFVSLKASRDGWHVGETLFCHTPMTRSTGSATTVLREST